MVFVRDDAAMFAGALMVSAEFVAGEKLTFEAATCVYPVKSSTGAELLDAAAKARCCAPDASETALDAARCPVPPISQ
jgi:hypothetical protein